MSTQHHRIQGDSKLTSCHSCRASHAKCDNQVPACRRCQKKGTHCVRETSFTFKNTFDSFKEATDVFSTSQTWVSSSQALCYHDEGPALVKHYTEASYEHTAAPGTIINYNSRSYDQEEVHHPRPSVISVGEVGPDSQSLQAVSTGRSTHSSVISPAMHTPLLEPFSMRDATLMRNFTEHMALWLDITDIHRHFEIEIPRRALTDSTLRYAIFAFSSRHLNRHNQKSDLTEALYYHNLALQSLIPQLSGPEEGLTEDVFAAVVMLRLDEEMDDIDNRFHLAGATRILNSISSFISSGGLGEAAAWTCLRQDIYISLVSKQPLKTKLDQFYASQWVTQDYDLSWANRMVLLLAKILSHAFLKTNAENEEQLLSLADELRSWNDKKPISFEPIRSTPHSKDPGKRLPSIWMLSPFHVLGVQYYHIARIVLLIVLPDTSTSQTGHHDELQRSRRVERTIKEHLLVILGLAISNPTAENTLFTARHALVAWGAVLRNALDQEAAINFLLLTEKKSGWRADGTIDMLSSIWSADQEDD